MRARAVAASLLTFALACGRLAPGTQVSSLSPEPPSPSPSPEAPAASPSPSAYILPEGRLPVVGPPDRFLFVCPTGQLLPRMGTPQEVREVARRLLEAAGAPEPDPRSVWALLDPSLQALFPSYEDFARQMRAAPYDATYDPTAEGGTEIYGLGPADGGYGGRLGDLLGQGRFCSPGTEAEILASYWMVNVTWRALWPCAACHQELYFLTRPEGIRYWAAL